MGTTTSRRGRRIVWIGVAVLVPLAVVAAFVFQPWKLFVDQTVDEAAPVASSSTGGSAPDAPRVISRGTFVSHEHESSGTVELLRRADGTTVLRLADLRTSNGPALHVWLSDAPVLPGQDGWFVFDDGRYLDLGDLKGNIGSSNYEIPADADLTGLTSVTVWCERFSVSFAGAALEPRT